MHVCSACASSARVHVCSARSRARVSLHAYAVGDASHASIQTPDRGVGAGPGKCLPQSRQRAPNVLSH
eukprot:15293279-Alexandrium_andersonii.AAC.1